MIANVINTSHSRRSALTIAARRVAGTLASMWGAAPDDSWNLNWHSADYATVPKARPS